MIRINDDIHFFDPAEACCSHRIAPAGRGMHLGRQLCLGSGLRQPWAERGHHQHQWNINSYYPGTGASVSAGSTSIPIGAVDTAGGGSSTAIASGDLLIVMQMQGAQINSSNTDCYGDGVGGCTTITFTTGAQYAGGNLATNYRAGLWEYCTATSAAGASVSVLCGGSGGGTVNAYQASSASSSDGAYRYQVIRVPQYSSVSMAGTVTAASWNGSTGGVLGLQATGTVTMVGFNLDAIERGFRGGGGVVYFSASASPTFSVSGGNAGVDRGNLAAGPLGDGVAEPWFATTGTFTVLGNSTTLTTACSTALSVTKTNGTTTLVAGSTTLYTVTFSNTGATSANDAIAKDTPSAGLSNCSVTACSGSGSPVAVCPANLAWPSLFTAGGLTLTSLPANSSLTFNMSCGVTAT
ncbi:MAG: hypothetical protein ACKO1L_09925, partial [Brachymonas sp.]